MCSLPNLQSKLVQSQNQMSKTTKTVVWTNQTCTSGWLNYPKYCGELKETNNDAEWGLQYQIVATLMARRMKNKCLKRTEKIQIKIMCCRVDIGLDATKSSPSPKPSVFNNKQPKSSHKEKYFHHVCDSVNWCSRHAPLMSSIQWH